MSHAGSAKRKRELIEYFKKWKKNILTGSILILGRLLYVIAPQGEWFGLDWAAEDTRLG